MGSRRAPFIAIKNHWDPRSLDEPWAAYSSEADSDLAIRLTEAGPGKGFHECLHFAFDYPDNRPDLHLYLPPTCFPSPETTDIADLLIFTYSEGGGPSPRHLVALVGHATLRSHAPRFDKSWPTLRPEDY